MSHHLTSAGKIVCKNVVFGKVAVARSKTKFAPRIFLQKYKMKSFLSRIRIHIYFCDTVPLKACVKVLRNGSTPRSIILWGRLT